LQIVVGTLDGILVHQPFRPEQGGFGRDRQDIENDGVITQKVIP
jgi:hypothetical protein